MDDELTTWDIVNWKVMLLLIFVYMLINSDMFIDNILSKISNTTNSGIVTAYGVLLQSLIMGATYVLFQPLATYDYI